MFTKEDYMKLSKERLAELLVEKDNQSITLQPTPFPTIIQEHRPLCYEPGGTCTNPHMDCINCPRTRTTGGTFTTNIGTSVTAPANTGTSYDTNVCK